MIVIGTAGHIDHGKSSIVKRLTGTDPDRLPEEKSRGMTIDLGFAFYKTPDGSDIAFVDVPGHERFVRNMIAGAGGTDAVMLVIAADDGWMPQSQEHFEIVNLLGVKHGLIVINKVDLVEDDWLDLLEQDVRQHVAGSFLAEAPIFRVSAQTGAGFDTLIDYLNQVPAKIEAKKDIGKARLYIDRAFVRPGIGRVVTGTLRGGDFSVGQPVSVWPGAEHGKIRSLQSHNEDVTSVTPGHRTAVSLTGVDKEKIVRGGVISDRTDLSYFEDHPVLALKVHLVKEAPVELTDRRRVLFIVGTTEMEGEIRLFDRKAIKPREDGIAFFRPDDPIYALMLDHFVIRLVTPMVTLGGGQVLDHLERFPRRRELDSLDYLNLRLSAKLEDFVQSEMRKEIMIEAGKLMINGDCSQTEVQDIVGALMNDKKVGQSGDYVFYRDYLVQAVERFTSSLKEHLQNQSHVKGLTLENIGDLSPFRRRTTRLLLDYMLAEDILVKEGELYNIAGRGMSLKGVIKQAHDEIMARLNENPFAPPSLSELASGGKNYQQAIKFILDTGEAHKCGSDFLFLTDTWRQVISYIREKLDRDGQMSVPDLRDKFSLTRKWVIPILEETDRQRLTERKGDIRVKGAAFEKKDTAL